MVVGNTPKYGMEVFVFGTFVFIFGYKRSVLKMLQNNLEFSQIKYVTCKMDYTSPLSKDRGVACRL